MQTDRDLPSPGGLALPAEGLLLPFAIIERAFPFYVLLDENFVIRGAGSSLARACPQVAPGSPLTRAFAVDLPAGKTPYQLAADQPGLSLVLVTRGQNLALRGQLHLFPAPGSAPRRKEDCWAIFLCNPSVTRFEQLHNLGLELSDFAGHDPTVDLLFLMQAHARASEEIRDMARRLDEEREALRRANQELSSQLNLKQQFEELSLNLEAARRATAVKSRFLAAMSHEVRTPINSVLGLLNLLRDTPLDPEQTEYLATIQSCTEALLDLLNNVLDLSKMESGRMTTERIPFHLGEFTSEILRVFSFQARAKGIETALELEPAANRRWLSDAMRLRQILNNLLGNALKFTDTGRIGLHVRGVAPPLELASAPGGERWLRFEVSDTGIGIDAAVSARLFESFTQADESISRRFGGTGLGLAICRQIATLLGGRIGVDSAPGAGSTFWFEIPLEADPEQVELEGAVAANEVPGR